MREFEGEYRRVGENSEKFLVIISQMKGLQKRIENMILSSNFAETMSQELKSYLVSRVCLNYIRITYGFVRLPFSRN